MRSFTKESMMSGADVTALFFSALIILLGVSAIAGALWYGVSKGLNKKEKTVFDATNK